MQCDIITKLKVKIINICRKSYMTYPEWRRDVPYETTATYPELAARC